MPEKDLEMKLAYLKWHLDAQAEDFKYDSKIIVVEDFIEEAMEEYNQGCF